jgi:hypothetical protein
MGNSGSIAKTAIIWLIAIAVAFFVLKAVIGAVMGIVSMVFGLVLLGLLAYAVIWAIKKL